MEAMKPFRRSFLWTTQEIYNGMNQGDSTEEREREKLTDLRYLLVTEPARLADGFDMKDKRENP